MFSLQESRFCEEEFMNAWKKTGLFFCTYVTPKHSKILQKGSGNVDTVGSIVLCLKLFTMSMASNLQRNKKTIAR